MAPGSPAHSAPTIPRSPPTIRGHLPPILHLHLHLSWSGAPYCRIHDLFTSNMVGFGCFVIFQYFDLHIVSRRIGGQQQVLYPYVCRLFVRSETPRAPHVLAIMRECVKVSTRVHPGHPLTTSICPPRRDQQWDGWTDELTQPA